MAIDRTNRLFEDAFSGNRGLYDGTLAGHLRRLAQHNARREVERLTLDPFTDSTGGTAPAEVKDISDLSVSDTSSSGGVTPASVNTGADTIMDAFAVLVTRLNKIRARIGMGSAPTGPGTVATAGTVAAIDDTLSAATGNSSASQSSCQDVLDDLKDRQRTVIEDINEVRRAVGLAEVATESADYQGDHNSDLTMAAISNASTVSSGNADTEGVKQTDVEAEFDQFADNIAYLIEQIDAVTNGAGSAGGFVVPVAVNFSDTKMNAGTSVWLVSPVKGRVRRLRTVVQDATTGAHALTLEKGGIKMEGSDVTIAGGASAGDTDDSGRMDHSTGDVDIGDAIEVTSDGGGSAGGAVVVVEIEPDEISGDVGVYAG